MDESPVRKNHTISCSCSWDIGIPGAGLPSTSSCICVLVRGIAKYLPPSAFAGFWSQTLCPLLTRHRELGLFVFARAALFLSAVRYIWVLPTECSVKLTHSQFACAALSQGLDRTLLAPSVDRHFLVPWLIKELSCQDQCWNLEVGLQSSKSKFSSVVLACKHSLTWVFWMRKPRVPCISRKRIIQSDFIVVGTILKMERASLKYGTWKPERQ